MTPAHVDPAQVAEAAFHIWVAEGKPHGRDQEHWYRALETLSTETSAATSPAPKKRRTAAPKATKTAAKTASTAAAAAPKSVKSTAKPANPAQAEAAAPKAARTTKAAKTAETAPKAAKPRARKPKAV